MRYCNPLSSERMEEALGRLEPGQGQAALDIGSGKGELLIRLAERWGVMGTGVERSARFVERSRREAARRVPAGLCWRNEDAREFEAAPGSFELTACIGSTHALGGYRETLRALGGWTRPGGRLLVGEGYWKKPPAPDYLDGLRASPDSYTDHQGNQALAREAGLCVVDCWESSPREWDLYEGRYFANMQAWALRHPADPRTRGLLRKARKWRRLYLKHGRETLGFGLYLLRKPG